jgi:hypothetical protein
VTIFPLAARLVQSPLGCAMGIFLARYLAEKFRQMTRLRPRPAIDTMLYIVLPKACRAPRIDWSRFWAPQAI